LATEEATDGPTHFCQVAAYKPFARDDKLFRYAAPAPRNRYVRATRARRKSIRVNP
jgi:hypothetical protein